MLGYTGQWKTWGSPELHTKPWRHTGTHAEKRKVSHCSSVQIKYCFYDLLPVIMLSKGARQFMIICGGRLDMKHFILVTQVWADAHIKNINKTKEKETSTSTFIQVATR